MKHSDEKFLMDVALLAADRSKALRLQVGAVVTDANGDMIATGYNGGIRGLKDEVLEKKIYFHNELGDLDKYNYQDENGLFRLETDETVTIHAEMNVLMHAARRGISVNNGTVFVTHSPCAKCTSLMIQAGIKEVVYNAEYRLHDEVSAQYGEYIRFRKFKG